MTSASYLRGLHSAKKWIKTTTCMSWHESGTYRAIEFSLLIHSKVKATVHASNTDQSHCHTDEFKDTWKKRDALIQLVSIQYIASKIQLATSRKCMYCNKCGLVFLKFQILYRNVYNIHRKAIWETSSRNKKPTLFKKLFFFYVEYERILFSVEAKAFSTMQLESIMITHYLLNCLLKHWKVGLNYLKIYFTFSIALS